MRAKECYFIGGPWNGKKAMLRVSQETMIFRVASLVGRYINVNSNRWIWQSCGGE